MEKYYLKAPQLNQKRIEELSIFQDKINIHFSELRLLNLAFTHTSYANEVFGDVDNNERLEFLGDSILGMVTAEYLFENLPVLKEGDFSRIKATVVSEESLNEVAIKLSVSDYLLLSKGEEMHQGRQKKAILADCMEAIIAAIYLDKGFECAKSFILSFIKDQVAKVLEGRNLNKDYKSLLQIYFQKKKNKVPEYLLDHVEGPNHDQKFYVKVFLGQKCYGMAEGSNKKMAEQNAAHLALKQLGLCD